MILINSGANASCKRVWNIQSGKSRVCSRRYKNVHAVCWARWHMKWKLTAASSAKLSHPPGDPILDTSGKLPFEQQWNPQYYWNIEFQSGFDLEQVSFPLSPSLFTSTVESFDFTWPDNLENLFIRQFRYAMRRRKTWNFNFTLLHNNNNSGAEKTRNVSRWKRPHAI